MTGCFTLRPHYLFARLIRSSVMISITCCYLMWSITYMAQLHPLIGEPPQSTALEELYRHNNLSPSDSTETRRCALRGGTKLEGRTGMLAVVCESLCYLRRSVSMLTSSLQTTVRLYLVQLSMPPSALFYYLESLSASHARTKRTK